MMIKRLTVTYLPNYLPVWCVGDDGAKEDQKRGFTASVHATLVFVSKPVCLLAGQKQVPLLANHPPNVSLPKSAAAQVFDF